MIQHKAVRYGLFVLWIAIAAGALYLYFFKREAVQSELRDALSASFWVASISYLLIGALRAFTLVPATFPLLVAMPFFDPWVLLALTIGLENLAGGMGTAAFVAYLSSLCNVAYTATQYALLSSLMAAARTWLSTSAGWLADSMSERLWNRCGRKRRNILLCCLPR